MKRFHVQYQMKRAGREYSAGIDVTARDWNQAARKATDAVLKDAAAVKIYSIKLTGEKS